jgi:hypothetical protein
MQDAGRRHSGWNAPAKRKSRYKRQKNMAEIKKIPEETVFLSAEDFFSSAEKILSSSEDFSFSAEDFFFSAEDFSSLGEDLFFRLNNKKISAETVFFSAEISFISPVFFLCFNHFIPDFSEGSQGSIPKIKRDTGR